MRLEVVVVAFLVLLFLGSSVAAVNQVVKGGSLALVDKVITDFKGAVAGFTEDFWQRPEVSGDQVDENNVWQDVVEDEIKTDLDEVLIPTKFPTAVPTKYYRRVTVIPTKVPTKPVVTKSAPAAFDQEAWWKQVQEENRQKQAEWDRQMEEFKQKSQNNLEEFKKQAAQGATEFAKQRPTGL